jgi:hypothetical protein
MIRNHLRPPRRRLTAKGWPPDRSCASTAGSSVRFVCKHYTAGRPFKIRCRADWFQRQSLPVKKTPKLLPVSRPIVQSRRLSSSCQIWHGYTVQAEFAGFTNSGAGVLTTSVSRDHRARFPRRSRSRVRRHNVKTPTSEAANTQVPDTTARAAEFDFTDAVLRLAGSPR